MDYALIKLMAAFCIKTEKTIDGREFCANTLVNCAFVGKDLNREKLNYCFSNYSAEKQRLLNKIKQFEK